MDKYTECELIPNAHLLLSSLRSVGYTEETAIADIIDNSISANATNIRIYFKWELQEIVIVDDGYGMSQKTLLESMKIGSADPNKKRTAKDLGRFGMGLKTAAFSLGKRLRVVSKENNVFSNACWDLDKIEQLDMWKVLIYNSNDEFMLRCIDMLKDVNNGTIVIIDKLDKVIDNNNLRKSENKFYSMVKKIKKHISLVFHRFIEEDKLNIEINNNIIAPWNPFIIENRATQELSCETYFGENDNVLVKIKPYILPHKTKFDSEEEFKQAGGPRGWFNQQGFYVYRKKRLLVYSTWFNIIKKEISYNLARIQVDIDSECDFDWQIDIKKSKAVPPVYLEEFLENIIRICIEKSASVYNSRGAYKQRSLSNNSNLSYVWEQRKNNIGKYSFFLNKMHPLLLQLKKGLDKEKIECLNAYLSLVENFSPVMMSGLADGMSNASLNINDEENNKDKMHIKQLIKIFRKNGFTNEEILETISNMASFRHMKDDIEILIMGEFDD